MKSQYIFPKGYNSVEWVFEVQLHF